MLNYETLFGHHFGDIIGQEKPVQKIGRAVYGTKLQNGYMPPLLLIAPVGTGKTKVMKAAMSLFKAIWGEQRKTIWAPSGKEFGNVIPFFEDILLPSVHGQETCFFVDECHEMTPGVQNLFRSMIELTTTREEKTVRAGGYEAVISPLRHGFVFATNEIDKVNPALVSRCKRIDLSLYTDEEMERILFQALDADGIDFHDNTLRAIAECNRGSARDVVKWVDNIREYVAFNPKRTKSLNKADVAKLISESEIYPLGVSKVELATLLILEERGPQKLKELANANQCKSNEQDTNEEFLRYRGLIKIETVRKLTQAGHEYLTQLRADKFIPEMKKIAGAIDIQ